MYGSEPIYKIKNGKHGRYCETCDREIRYLVPGDDDIQMVKITNRCKGPHEKEVKKLEECYYCHLQNHHVVESKEPTRP